MTIVLEVGNLDGLISLMFALMFGPAILLFIIAIIFKLKNKKKTAKIFWILGVVYLIISFGICGSLMMN